MALSMVAVPSGTASVPAGTGIAQSEEVENGDVFSERNINSVTSCNETSSPGDALEEINCGTDENGDQECAICMGKLCSPRVLSCLHVFCEACLDKLLMDEAGDPKVSSVLVCPICQQETSISSKGAASLTCDYVLTNILDMSAIENMAVLCTSCKAKDSAVARCSDCANFLCPSCDCAHQFMRCFESHKVVAFEDLKKSNETVPIHKPIFCECHPAENMKFYCYTCQEPICNECLLVEHKAPDHQYERLLDAEPRQKEELIKLVNESKARIADCDQVSAQLDNALRELQAQHDQAKDLIIETFQSYKAILEKCRDNALDELEKLHSDRELEIMDSFHSVEKTVEKIENACRFTSRLLEYGDAVEILALRRIVGTQLTNLIKNTPKPNVSFSIEFQTDYNQFEETVKDVFGKFHTESTPVVKSEALTTVPGVSTSQQVVHTSMGCPRSISIRSPISLPASMQSSFEGEPSFVIPPTSSPQNIPPPPPPVSLPPGPIHGLTSIQEYNLQQLASLAEKVEMVGDTNVVGPASSPNPTQPFILAELFAGDLSSTSHAINNLQALAKLGNTLGNQDLGNPAINGGSGLVLGRGPSPAIVDTPNLSLAPNSLLNGGFQSLSSSTSPIISQSADDLMGDSMHNIPVAVGNSVGNVTGSGSGNYAHPRSNNAKFTPMHIRCKFGQLGPSKGQFSSPHGFCLSADEDIIVADTNNHRIQIFDKTGVFKFQFGVPGKEEGQLWYPRKVAVMRNSGKFVVCDRGNERSRMQIFTKNGHFIKKIAIRYIDIVAGLAVTSEGQILAVDSVSPTVFVINEIGALCRWFDCSEYMREPSDIAISGKEYFVCDFKGHCVVVFSESGKFLRRIGCDNVTNFPNGIDISDAGDILIGDSHGNRFHVAVFSRDGSLISEFECPYVKVSRCCGLKITSEGYIVTLAKNNHHVLVLNTLYIS
ncbi:protein meiotic P26 [Nomia melanderi]|uniref:protein meiotic P26 n=1 Tax=Nomia melanderi TaxID=2448451 RepID=UPI001304356A|nr:B-box type zinc finger protein ncl-1-like [Nomia melanderi]XP_031830071.1 B-box type zinc finger protein ncl-1-like [Nomia melanderi]XP_031830072.1 B-box type zinc finger protein ncl-1-like [Nomia melanderi]XP_031830073.1 B-box type zinc finger protein ncl-1-like [Nomia melanderi]XP_031830074.1 B-box type zinc finger protein ncl-1-like [Nomia melanderi]XP_031830075.1 B-box type zinc finger protein ncl-1-like [Nomia melanderi]XP_031830076.1 B-box type zinc finger protein ncl-1-like [Nomia m